MSRVLQEQPEQQEHLVRPVQQEEPVLQEAEVSVLQDLPEIPELLVSKDQRELQVLQVFKDQQELQALLVQQVEQV